MEEVIVVTPDDVEKGTMEKMAAHEQGVLHRAFSIFVFNSDQQLLIHQRALHKYHSGGLWTNTCCSHPRPGEIVITAGHRRLLEEMGMTSNLLPGFQFIYKAELDQGLTEHELDHVLFGYSDAIPAINEDEVAAWRYVSLEELESEIQSEPDSFTAWLKICIEEHLPKIRATLPILLQEKSA